jgi:uncharacterized protein
MGSTLDAASTGMNIMIMAEPFRPPPHLRWALLQTVLASSRLRTFGPNPMLAAARPMILTTEGGVRLLGSHSPQPGRRAKGLVILLHGWEGSIDSTYVLRTGRHLFGGGYSIFRLNLRDHGKSHHLNPGLFFATLFDEVFQAVGQAARLADGRPVFLAGFSLGGNFALRIARHCAQEPIPGLRHVISISPVLDPDKATDRIDRDPILLHYFLRKWKRSLIAKQTLYPQSYHFGEVLRLRSIRRMTDHLLARYSQFTSSEEYFRAYSLLDHALQRIALPTTIITAQDDPIIPIDDFCGLQLGPHCRLTIHRHGGHNGFIEGIFLGSWYERKMVELFDRIAGYCTVSRT